MARVVCICTYPISVPRHGGQLRVNAIQQVYREAGHDVRHLAVYRDSLYPNEPPSSWNIHFTPEFINDLITARGRDDVNAPDYLMEDMSVQRRALKLVTDFKPDIIQLEHCWMWPLIKVWRTQIPSLRNARLVYSSQNVEHELLPKNDSNNENERQVFGRSLGLIQRMEMDLVKSADLVIACSARDAKVFHPLAQEVIVAPNGIWPKVPGTGGDYWRKEMAGRRLALFVGSAHPPNASGFVSILGPHLGFLSPNERIIIVGQVSNLLTEDHAFRKHMGLNLARAIMVGQQDPGGLSTLIDIADVIVVPIVEGGGTNIKMAEAIYNRKPIICTSKSMRGYEAFLSSPLILVRDTPAEFQSTLTKVLRGHTPLAQLTRADVNRLPDLLWSSTLSPLLKRLPYILGDASKGVS